MDCFGLRGDLEKLIQGPGLVRFQVRPRNVPQPGWVDNLSNRFQSQGKEQPLPGVKQERCFIRYEELVEGDVGLRDEGRDPKDTVSDYVHFSHLFRPPFRILQTRTIATSAGNFSGCDVGSTR